MHETTTEENGPNDENGGEGRDLASEATPIEEHAGAVLSRDSLAVVLAPLLDRAMGDYGSGEDVQDEMIEAILALTLPPAPSSEDLGKDLNPKREAVVVNGPGRELDRAGEGARQVAPVATTTPGEGFDVDGLLSREVTAKLGFDPFAPAPSREQLIERQLREFGVEDGIDMRDAVTFVLGLAAQPVVNGAKLAEIIGEHRLGPLGQCDCGYAVPDYGARVRVAHHMDDHLAAVLVDRQHEWWGPPRSPQENVPVLTDSADRALGDPEGECPAPFDPSTKAHTWWQPTPGGPRYCSRCWASSPIT